MPGIINKIVDMLQTAADFYTLQHPAKRGAPHRDWDYPQIAGYESHPYFSQIKEAFQKVPLSESVSDFQLRRGPSVEEVPDVSPSTSAWINSDTRRIALVPLSARQAKLATAHELGHNYMFDTFRVSGPGTEIPATIIATKSLEGKPPSAREVEKMLRVVNEPETENDRSMGRALFNAAIWALDSAPVDRRKYTSVWK